MNKIWIQCGIIIDSDILVQNDFRTYNNSHINNDVCYSYPLENAIKKIVELLNIKCFYQEIKYLVLQTKFNYKLNQIDKVIICTYHILKASDYPIIVSDFKPYTSLKKSKLLKIYRDSFQYVEKLNSYLFKIFERAMAFLKDLNIDSNLCESEFYKYTRLFHNANPYDICIVAALNKSNHFENYNFINKLPVSFRERLRHLHNKLSAFDIIN